MPDLVPDACSCAALREATRHMTRFYDEALASSGLGINQYSILSKLGRAGPQTLRDMADRLVMDRSTLARLLRPLEARGLVTVSVSAEDRRHRVLMLTPSGATVVNEAHPLWIAAEQRFQTVFGAEQAITLRSVLKHVTTIALAA